MGILARGCGNYMMKISNFQFIKKYHCIQMKLLTLLDHYKTINYIFNFKNAIGGKLMIVGIFLRYIKTYRGLHYIPLVYNDKFCGLVGDNGIGKSSILEALDAVLNNKQFNLNAVTKRSGYTETDPHVVPVFLFKKSDLPENLKPFAQILHQVATQISDGDYSSPYVKAQIKKFINHKDIFSKYYSTEEYYILPIGVDRQHEISFSFFLEKTKTELHRGTQNENTSADLSDEEKKTAISLLDWIKNSIDYIYVPKEIDADSFTKLEAKEIHSLMGQNLNQIIEGLVSAELIQSINRSLNAFLGELADELMDYSYRTRTDRQQNLRKQDVYNLIIQAFFNIRKLHKKHGEGWLEIDSLSSGEKQKAIIDIAHSLIMNHRSSSENLILAIDEPESSLHMSACFDQFDTIFKISRSCKQVLFATHWYGFFPTIESGSVAVITKHNDDHLVDLINLSNHREQVKQITKANKGSLPYDVRLKGMNDFVQSIVTSIVAEEPFNWIICEGSSEKLYLSAYLQDLINAKRLRIVPIGGAKEIKRLYQYLFVSYDEFRSEAKGRIFLLSDTDAELVQYDTTNFDHLKCSRIITISETKSVSLVNIRSNPVSPKTEIEDVLDGKCFYKTLKSFIPDYSELNFLNTYEEISDLPSFFALDLRTSERELIQKFFDQGNNKFIFAEKYISHIKQDTRVPEWITKIRQWLESGNNANQ